MKIEVNNEIYKKLCHTKETLELFESCNSLTERQKGMLDCFRMHFPIFGNYEGKLK